MKGEKNWPEVPFAKLSWSSMAQTLAELAVDLLGPAGLLAKGGPDAVDRGKWTTAVRLPALLDHRRRLDRDPEEHHRRPGHRHARQVARLTASRCVLPSATDAVAHEPAADPRHLHHRRRPPHLAPRRLRGGRRDGQAPEPLDMWEQVAARPRPTRAPASRARSGRSRASTSSTRSRGSTTTPWAGWPSAWGVAAAAAATRASAGRCPTCWRPRWRRRSGAGDLDLGAARRRARRWPRCAA